MLDFTAIFEMLGDFFFTVLDAAMDRLRGIIK